jgi:hypothetical protein
MRSIFLPSVLAALGTVGCAAAPPPGPSVATPSKAPERVQKPTEKETAVTGEVPQNLIAKMRADLAGKIGSSQAESARVVTSEAVTWPDGSMGCAEPGTMYTQALVPGYRVLFQVNEVTYAYHAAQSGSFKHCPNDPRRPNRPRPVKEP